MRSSARLALASCFGVLAGAGSGLAAQTPVEAVTAAAGAVQRARSLHAAGAARFGHGTPGRGTCRSSPTTAAPGSISARSTWTRHSAGIAPVTRPRRRAPRSWTSPAPRSSPRRNCSPIRAASSGWSWRSSVLRCASRSRAGTAWRREGFRPTRCRCRRCWSSWDRTCSPRARGMACSSRDRWPRPLPCGESGCRANAATWSFFARTCTSGIRGIARAWPTAIGADSVAELPAALAAAARVHPICLAPAVDSINGPGLEWRANRLVLTTAPAPTGFVPPLSVFRFARTGLTGSVWTSSARDVYDLAARRNHALCSTLFVTTDALTPPAIPACSR